MARTLILLPILPRFLNLELLEQSSSQYSAVSDRNRAEVSSACVSVKTAFSLFDRSVAIIFGIGITHTQLHQHEPW
jgi:hypothetical protein